MKCLRCGYCCINYDVIIIDDGKLPLSETNIKHKPSGVACQHLIGTKPGEYSCAIHDHPDYNQTPCFDFTQVERQDSDCRMGVYQLKNYHETNKS